MTLATRTVLFVAYCASVAFGNLDVLRALVDYSQQNDHASHVVLIPLVTLALVWQERKSIFSPVRTDWWLGAAVIVAALGTLVSARSGWPPLGLGDSLTLEVGALVAICVGGFLLFYGRAASRAALFPLCFLALMIPIPEALLEGAVRLLKAGSTEVVSGLFTLTRTTNYREGFVFHLPSLTIEVADSCSGIRSSIALALTSLLAGHMFLKRPWSKGLLVLAAFPVAILKNGIRIVSLSLLSIHVDPGFIVGRLHHEGGVVFFVLGLMMLAPCLAILRRAETPTFSRQLGPHGPHSVSSSSISEHI